MAWTNSVVTNGGVVLLRQVLDGASFTAVSAEGGTGTVSAVNLMNQTQLVNKKQDFSLLGIQDVEDGKVFRIQINNRGLEEGYTLNQIAIWARVDNGPSVFFSIMQDPVGIAIPASSDNPVFLLHVNAIVDFSNEAEFKAIVDPGALATLQTLTDSIKAHNESEEAHEFIRESIDNLLPSTFIGMVEHNLGHYPICTLYSTYSAAGIGGAGESGAGGENIITVPAKYEFEEHTKIIIATVRKYVDFTEIHKINNSMFCFIDSKDPDNLASLFLTLNIGAFGRLPNTVQVSGGGDGGDDIGDI